jgi:hypothetical protein
MNSYCSAGRPSIYDINQDRVGQQVQKEDHSISSTGKFGKIRYPPHTALANHFTAEQYGLSLFSVLA